MLAMKERRLLLRSKNIRTYNNAFETDRQVAGAPLPAA
jgi:hypothetical protein